MANSDFSKRLLKAQELINKVKYFLDENNIPYFETGYEFLLSKNNAVGEIKKLNDETSEFIRYYPDLCIVLKKNSILLEAKNSTGIEKNCYYNYSKLKETQNIKIVICNKNIDVCSIDRIKFNEIKEFDEVAQMNIPVTDKIWKEPRLLPKNEYHKYLEKYRQAKKYTSGCSFAFIDFRNTEFVPIIELLKLL